MKGCEVRGARIRMGRSLRTLPKGYPVSKGKISLSVVVPPGRLKTSLGTEMRHHRIGDIIADFNSKNICSTTRSLFENFNSQCTAAKFSGPTQEELLQYDKSTFCHCKAVLHGCTVNLPSPKSLLLCDKMNFCRCQSILHCCKTSSPSQKIASAV